MKKCTRRILNKTHVGLKVKVYYNLHRHCFSVKDYKTNKVIGHTDRVVLQDCTFKVSEAGRRRVLLEKKKNVHAYVVGTLKAWDFQHYVTPVNHKAHYNPYFTETFEVDGMPIYESPWVVLQHKTIYVVAPKVLGFPNRQERRADGVAN